VTALIGPALLSVTAVVALMFAREFGFWSFGAPGAGLLPGVAAALLLLASLSDMRFSSSGRGLPAFSGRVAAYVAGLVLLVAVTPLTGLLPALAIFIFGVLRFVERLVMLRAALIAGTAIIASWLLFERILSVPLPKSMFW